MKNDRNATRPPILVDLTVVGILCALGRALVIAPTELFSLARIGGFAAFIAAGVIFATVLKERRIL